MKINKEKIEELNELLAKAKNLSIEAIKDLTNDEINTEVDIYNQICDIENNIEELK